MTSIIFSPNELFLIEYIYSGQSIPTSDIGFRKIENEYSEINVIVNENAAGSRTRNLVDNTLVKRSDGLYPLLDNDSAFFYPDTDDNINVSDVTFPTPYNIEYDTVRIHILSGYNLPNSQGVYLALGCRETDGRPLKLLSYAYLKSDSNNLIINSKPLRSSIRLYDRYVEVKVPSLRYLIQQQKLLAPDNPAQLFSRTGTLSEEFTILAEFGDIRAIDTSDGLAIARVDNIEAFTFSATDTFNSFIPKIEQAEDGDYFRFFAEYDGLGLEEFIFNLNSLAGNDYVLVHEIAVIEQVGLTFTETDSLTTIQIRDFTEVKRFRPILRRGDQASSFTIEYTARLLNRLDGRSIFKTASVSSTEVQRYSKRGLRINVGEGTIQQRIFNKIVDSTGTILNNIDRVETVTRYTPTLIDRADVRVTVNGEEIESSRLSDRVNISLNPFDNNYRFAIFSQGRNGSIQYLNLRNYDYLMIFRNSNGDEVVLEESRRIGSNKINGELFFTVPKDRAQTLIRQQARDYYVVRVTQDGQQESVFTGLFNPTTDLIAAQNQDLLINDLQNELEDTRASLNSRIEELEAELARKDETIRSFKSQSNSTETLSSVASNPTPEARVLRNTSEATERLIESVSRKRTSRRGNILNVNQKELNKAKQATRNNLSDS